MGVTTGGHSHVTSVVTSSIVNVFDVNKLLSMDRSQAKTVADRALAFGNTRDNKTFAFVVSGKSDRGINTTNIHGGAGKSTLCTLNIVSCSP